MPAGDVGGHCVCANGRRRRLWVLGGEVFLAPFGCRKHEQTGAEPQRPDRCPRCRCRVVVHVLARRGHEACAGRAGYRGRLGEGHRVGVGDVRVTASEPVTAPLVAVTVRAPPRVAGVSPEYWCVTVVPAGAVVVFEAPDSEFPKFQEIADCPPEVNAERNETLSA